MPRTSHRSVDALCINYLHVIKTQWNVGKGSKRIDLDHFLQFCKLALVMVMDMLPEILLCYTMLLYSCFVQAITLVSDSGFVQFTYFVVYKGK